MFVMKYERRSGERASAAMGFFFGSENNFESNAFCCEPISLRWRGESDPAGGEFVTARGEIKGCEVGGVGAITERAGCPLARLKRPERSSSLLSISTSTVDTTVGSGADTDANASTDGGGDDAGGAGTRTFVDCGMGLRTAGRGGRGGGMTLIGWAGGLVTGGGGRDPFKTASLAGGLPAFSDEAHASAKRSDR